MAITSTADASARDIAASAGPDGVRRPGWERPALIVLLVAAAVLYLWNLSATGWGNDFYAAAAHAGTQSWKALLFGSLDPGNSITVDKPPAAMWVMALSGRIFGFTSWSMLVPEALMGVGSVALLHAAVRRWCGPAAGLVAGAALASTPVATMMFRFNNPDALLVFLLTAAAYCTVRATEAGRVRWLALAGVAMGFAFLTKLMQAFLVLPALVLVFLVAAPLSLRKRVGGLLAAAVALAVSAGWYLVLMAVWPVDSRPYIGGSTDNSLIQLTLGYNGFGRLLGGHGNPGGPGGPGRHGGNEWHPPGNFPGFGGHVGITRLFGDAMGTEVSWLLPAALIGLVAGLWVTRSAPRTDRTRAALLLWGGWMVVSGLVFSYMSGIIHPYYMIALAPGIAGVIGISTVELWRRRASFAARATLAAMLVATGVWDFVLLDRTPDWFPWLRWVVLLGCLAGAAALVAVAQLRRFGPPVLAASLVFGVAATAAYTVDTASQTHSGGIPLAGPQANAFMNGPGPGPGNHRGPGIDDEDDTALRALLSKANTRWAAATVGSFQVSGLELSTGKSLMAIGGFNGGDPSPTLEQFQRYVAKGEIRYFLLGDTDGPGMSDDSAGTRITDWVRHTFTPIQVGDATVYDLR